MDKFNQSRGINRQLDSNMSAYTSSKLQNKLSIEDAKESIDNSLGIDRIREHMELLRSGGEITLSAGMLAKAGLTMAKNVLNHQAISKLKNKNKNNTEEVEDNSETNEEANEIPEETEMTEFSPPQTSSNLRGNVQDDIMDRDPEDFNTDIENRPPPANESVEEEPEVDDDVEDVEDVDNAGEVGAEASEAISEGAEISSSLSNVLSSVGLVADVAGIGLGGYSIYEGYKSLQDDDEEEQNEDILANSKIDELTSNLRSINPTAMVSSSTFDSLNAMNNPISHF